MNRVLLIVGGLLVGLLAALFVVPGFVDWTRYRGTFEDEATKLLGRDVRVGGSVNLRLLPTPYIRFEKVRVADIQATVGEPLFRAEALTIWLAIGPLFSRKFEATEIEVRKPALTLVLDGQGSGNWTSLAKRPARAAFVPDDIALRQVQLLDGAITIFDAAGNNKGRIEHVNGELSATAVEGPYKVALAFAAQGVPREVRFATAKAEADGTVRLKGTMRSPATGASYTLDGQLLDLFGKPSLNGDVMAKLPLPAADDSGASTAAAKTAAEASFELKGKLTADTAGAQLADLNLTFEQDGKPQLAVGEARMSWHPESSTHVELSSRWLDLDRIGGGGAAATVPSLLQRFAERLEAHFPATSKATARVTLEQATLGGDIVSGVSLALERRSEGLQVQASAAIPGSSRMQVAGLLNAQSRTAVFSGDVALRGANFARFAAWAGRNTGMPDAAKEQPFLMSGKLTFGPERVTGRQITLQMPGNSVSGEFAWARAGANPQISVALEGSELDLSPLMQGKTGAAAVVKAFRDQIAAARNAASAAVAGLPNGNVRLRVGRVIAGASVLRDVSADVALEGGNLSVPLLRTGSEDGWSIELSGNIAGLTKPDAKGTLAATLAADTPQGLAELVRLAGLDDAMLPSAARAKLLLPLRIAGRMRLSDAGADAFAAGFDGTAGSQRISGTLKTDGAGDSWRDWKLDAAATIDGPQARSVLDLVAPERLQLGTSSSQGSEGPGRLSVRTIGTAKSGLVSLLAFDAQGLAAEYRGKLAVTDAAKPKVDGQLRLVTNDLAAAWTLLGGKERPSLRGKPLQGTIALTGEPERMRLAAERLQLGGATLSGHLEHESTGANFNITGRIASTDMSLPAVLDGLTVATPSPGGPRPRGAPASIWGEQAFDLAGLAGWSARIAIVAPRLEIAPEIALGNSALDVQVKDGRLEIGLTGGEALGGKATGALTLERAQAGAHAKLKLAAAGMKAEALSATGLPAMNGLLSVDAQLEASALSPRGLVAALNGQGQLSLAGAKLNRLTPRALKDSVDALIATKVEIPPGELKRRLAGALTTGGASLGSRTLPIAVADGIVKFATIAVDTPEGRLTGVTAIDLEALRVDSEWRIDPPAEAATASRSAKATRPLPGISVVYAGSLARLGTIEPSLQIEDLERELTVRKMERDLEDLERIRRQDEDRARREAEQRPQERERDLPPLAPPTLTVPLPIPVPVPVPDQKRSERVPPTSPAPRLEITTPAGDSRAPTEPAVTIPSQGAARPASAATVIPLPGAPGLPQQSQVEPAQPAAVSPLPDAAEPAASDLPNAALQPQVPVPRPAAQPRPAARPARDVFRELGRSGP